jgi:ornithine--oxo-acid transaminase
VAIAALGVLKDEGLAENAEKMGTYFRNGINNIRSNHLQLVRGRGLLNAIVIDDTRKNAGWELCLELKNNGLLAKPTHGNKIRLAPPLIITIEQLDESIRIIEKSLKVLDA